MLVYFIVNGVSYRLESRGKDLKEILVYATIEEIGNNGEVIRDGDMDHFTDAVYAAARREIDEYLLDSDNLGQ